MPRSDEIRATLRADEPWTTRRLLRWMIDHFESKGIDSPRVVAEMLLAHVIGCDRLRLYMEVDRPASTAEREQLRELVVSASRHEPVQYLVGEAWFFGMPFMVNRSTLIPRPSTETLVEEAIRWIRSEAGAAPQLVADIGTGTGCIAITLAKQVSDLRVIATDLLVDALALAGRNAERHGVADRIDRRQGPGLMPIAGDGPFDMICSNPPYIPADEWSEVGLNVRGKEPDTALRGGEDGMDVIRPLIHGAAELLRPGGCLLVEIATSQREPVLELVEGTSGLGDSTVVKDHEGLWRMLKAVRA